MQSRGGDLGRGARAGVEEREEKRTVQERSQCAADEMGFHQSGARYRCYKDYQSESRCALQVGPSLRRRVAVPSVTPKGERGAALTESRVRLVGLCSSLLAPSRLWITLLAS